MNISNRITTLDVKDLDTNLPKQGILMATKHWLGSGIGSKEENEELLMALGNIMQHNYFQYNNTHYRPSKGAAMVSPLSGTLAELYLQLLEKQYIKHWISSREVSYYKRYVDDILIIYNENRITKEKILQEFNKVDSNLEFKMTTEDNKCISFLDLNIHRKPNRTELGIYRKETNTDTSIHNQSNHPQEHKVAAYRFHINRLLTLPLTQKEKARNGKQY